MNKPVKTKLCWNCEGSVSRSIENCPYCGVYLSPEESNTVDSAAKAESAFQAPYSPQNRAEEVPKAPYNPSQEATEVMQDLTSNTSSVKTVFLPVLFLSAGIILLLFSLLILLFSTQGTLTLVWNEEYWLYFFLISLPCLMLGYKFVSQIEEV